ncbi:MAG: radical SAM protein [Paracoccaceae bacterium]
MNGRAMDGNGDGVGANAGKFRDPAVTADGSTRATVALSHPRTLWFNTGTLCNIACTNCYIDSSPTNDALEYITAKEVARYLNELAALGWPVEEIGFTGGEPFLNPGIIRMVEDALERGYRVLVLTSDEADDATAAAAGAEAADRALRRPAHAPGLARPLGTGPA